MENYKRNNDKYVFLSHEDGIAIKKAMWILNTRKMKSQRDPKIVDALKGIIDKLRSA